MMHPKLLCAALFLLGGCVASPVFVDRRDVQTPEAPRDARGEPVLSAVKGAPGTTAAVPRRKIKHFDL